MTPVLVLALALMVMAVGSAVVVALQLRRAASGLASGMRATADRLRPLAGELQEGTAVTAAEAEALQASVGRLTASRQGRSRRSA